MKMNANWWKKKTTIAIDKSLKEYLDERKGLTESYNACLLRLLKLKVET